MGENKNQENICLKHNCHECCRPVKVKKDFKNNAKETKLPFKDKKEVWIPESHPNTVRLETYECKLFDKKTGLCKDYENRPEICRNTKCEAFEARDEKKQAEIIKKIKNEKYYKIKMR